jgi:hypothetical protein
MSPAIWHDERRYRTAAVDPHGIAFKHFAMTDEIVCEVEVRGRWQPLDLDAALKLASSRVLRCIECGGRVRAHKAGSNGQKAHMEHGERHPGCSRGDCYDGTSRPHHRHIT